MQAQLAKERRDALQALIDKFQIKVNAEQQLKFKDLMKTRSLHPLFFYEFKKNRTILTREKEHEKKEPFHVVFIRK